MEDAVGSESIETELKLQLDARQLNRLKRVPAFDGIASSQQQLDNMYFDSAGWLLQQHLMSLRLRRVNGRWLQTLKTAGTGSGAMSQRGEWETPAKTAPDGSAKLDLRRLSQSPLPSLLSQQKSKPRLRPVFSTRVQRTLWRIERDQTQIEVALDVGEITATVDGKPMREPICELELELKRGDATAVIDLALDLINASGKTPLQLLPLVRSKAERGYQLACEQPADALKASAKGFTEKLTPKMSAAQALRAVMAHGLTVVITNCELLLDGDDPEYVHQARVALRRVRSAVRLFDRAQRDVPERLIDELRWFGRALGTARDWDVFVDQTLPRLQKDAGAGLANENFRGKAEQRRRDERLHLRDAVHSARYAAFVLNVARWCLSAAPADAELLEDLAKPTLQRLAKKLFKSARFFSALTTERRHRVRIQAKRLRYALDLFSIALPKRSTARYVDALAELQDLLGALNDASVANDALPQLTGSARIRRSVRQSLAAAEPEQVQDIETRLLKLTQLEAPWT